MLQNTFSKSALAIGLAALGFASSVDAASFRPFSFTSNISTSGQFDDGDIRLDSVSLANGNLSQEELQTVEKAKIIQDDATDAINGGHNLAAGRGIHSVEDPWAPQGPATVTPTSEDLAAALGNFNLTSIVVTRENTGTAILDVKFDHPTNTFFFWERGNATAPGNGNSDILVEAFDEHERVIAAYKIQRAAYTATGIEITTDNGAFLSPRTPGGVKPVLGSIGLYLDKPTRKLRLTSQQNVNGIKDDGPDFKLVASERPLPARIPFPRQPQ